MAKKYDESSIQVLQGLDAPRKKPGMYVGTVDKFGLYQLWKEAHDNACDEAGEGHGKVITTIIDTKTSTISVCDEGRGIPVGIHKKTKISTLTTVLGTLHAGGKIDDTGSYKTSAGTFGVGISVTNALSSSFKAWTFRDGEWYHQAFEKGKAVTKVEKQKPKIKAKCGTVVSFVPDFSIFTEKKIPVNLIKAWVQNAAYFHPVKFVLIVDGKEHSWFYKDGAAAFVQSRLKQLQVEALGKPFVYKDSQVTCIAQWALHEDEDFTSYVNGSKTAQGGTHYNGFTSALKTAFEQYKKKKHKFKIDDLKIGLIGFLSVKIGSPSFSSQTKEKLSTPEAKALVEQALTPTFKQFFSKNKSLVKDLIERSEAIHAANEDFKLSKRAAAKLKTKKQGKLKLPAKLTESITKDPKLRELFLVEGDSAGGTARNARDKQFQEILALKGKILNVYKAKSDRVFASNEVMDILQSIGYDPSKPNPYDNLRVGKIIFLCDEDEDGKHIATLLSGLMQLMLRPLIEQGRVFKVNAPLFTTQVGSKQYSGESKKDVLKQLPESQRSKVFITRMKGWGEAPSAVLKTAAFDVKTRKLMRLMPVKGKELKRFQSMLNAETDIRKELLGLN